MIPGLAAGAVTRSSRGFLTYIDGIHKAGPLPDRPFFSGRDMELLKHCLAEAAEAKEAALRKSVSAYGDLVASLAGGKKVNGKLLGEVMETLGLDEATVESHVSARASHAKFGEAIQHAEMIAKDKPDLDAKVAKIVAEQKKASDEFERRLAPLFQRLNEITRSQDSAKSAVAQRESLIGNHYLAFGFTEPPWAPAGGERCTDLGRLRAIEALARRVRAGETDLDPVDSSELRFAIANGWIDLPEWK